MAFLIASIGIATFSMMDAAMKSATIAIGVYNAMLWRNLAIAVLAGAVHFARWPGWPARTAMRLHIVRGCVALAMALLFFWGLARVPMAQAISLSYIAPLVAILLAAVLLGEAVRRASVAGSLFALGGVVVILIGQGRAGMGDDALWGAAAILCSALCYGWNIILARQQALVAGPSEVAFWQTFVALCLLALAAPWLVIVPPAAQIPALGMAGLLATVSLMLLAWAYGRAGASYLAPSEYTSFLWAALFGWLFFGETVTAWTIGGAGLIVAGCIRAARRRPKPFAQAETIIP
ncbi:DMT family transporter [Stakelama flava]|nr:DMT family transporter [Stakelama flava]